MSLIFQKSEPPEKYVPSFCSAILSNIKTMFDSVNSNIGDLIHKIEIFERDISVKNENFERDILVKNENFEKDIAKQTNELIGQYHEIDKEMFKVKNIHGVVKDQSGLNVKIIEQLKTLDDKFKILFRIIFLLLTSNVGFGFFMIRSLFSD